MHGNNNANSEKREKGGKKRIGNRYTRGSPFICNILFFKKKKEIEQIWQNFSIVY